MAVAVHKSQGGLEPDPGFAISALELGLLSALGLLCAFRVFGISFLAWFHASHKRLRENRLEPQYASGWAIGGFFVPFLNLVRPYQVMKEVWQGSEFLAPGDDQTPWQERRAGHLVGQWWMFVLLSAIAGKLWLRTALDPETIPEMLESAYKGLASNLIDVLAAWVTVLLVKTIASFQDASVNRLAVKPIEPGSEPDLG